MSDKYANRSEMRDGCFRGTTIIPNRGKIWRGLQFGYLTNRKNIAKFKFSPNLNSR